MKKIFLVLVAIFILQFVNAQSTISPAKQIRDTLFFTMDKKLVKGQKIIIGKPSGENGWYNYIGYKNYTALPLLINRKMDLENQYSGQADPEQVRENDLVKEYLKPGDTVIVKQFKLITNKHDCCGHRAILIQQKFLRIRFNCNIEKALAQNEIVIP